MIEIILMIWCVMGRFIVFSNSTVFVSNNNLKCHECPNYSLNQINDIEYRPTTCNNETTTINMKLLENRPSGVTMAIYSIDLQLSYSLDSYGLPSYIEVIVGENEPERYELEDEVVNDECSDCVKNKEITYSPPYGQIGREIQFRGLGNIVCISKIEVIQFFTIEALNIIDYYPVLGPIEGGTYITFIGSNFNSKEQYYCLINGIKIESEKINEQQRSCITPKNKNQSQIEIQLFSENFPLTALTNVTFDYYDVLFESARIYKDNEGSNQQIEVCGKGIIKSNNIECLISSQGINETRVGGIYLNEECVLCFYNTEGITTPIEIIILLNGQNKSNSVILRINQKITYGIIILIVLTILIIILITIGMFIVIYRIYNKRKKDNIKGWININELYLNNKISIKTKSVIWMVSWKGVKFVLKDQMIDNSNEFEQIKENIKTIKEIRHPCIIQYFGYSIEYPHLYLLMEFMPKHSLFNVLHSNLKIIPIATKFRIINEISKGLAYLHDLNPPIVHGNLNSNNVLVEQNYSIKLSDICLGFNLSLNDSIPWKAPEVLTGNKPTTKSDIYSFGIILWEIITNQIPFDDIDLKDDLILNIVLGQRPPLINSIPVPCKELLLSCWKINTERLISIDEIVMKVESWKNTQF
ncbi:protein kinase domain containing protein [Entamoeba histolytica]|nr:protein kinase domain containing protein [Entamoeba histolytica]